MTEAPEKIWAWALDKFNGKPFWAGEIKVSHSTRDDATEYRRADLPPKEADRGVHSDLIERMRVAQKALLNGGGIESAVNVLMEAAICLDKAGGYGSLEGGVE